jgi:hypothetical protein
MRTEANYSAAVSRARINHRYELPRGNCATVAYTRASCTNSHLSELRGRPPSQGCETRMQRAVSSDKLGRNNTNIINMLYA